MGTVERGVGEVADLAVQFVLGQQYVLSPFAFEHQQSDSVFAVWQILCGLAPNYGTMVVGRFLGGLSSAGGSVTLGMGMSSLFDLDICAYIDLAL